MNVILLYPQIISIKNTCLTFAQPTALTVCHVSERYPLLA